MRLKGYNICFNEYFSSIVSFRCCGNSTEYNCTQQNRRAVTFKFAKKTEIFRVFFIWFFRRPPSPPPRLHSDVIFSQFPFQSNGLVVFVFPWRRKNKTLLAKRPLMQFILYQYALYRRVLVSFEPSSSPRHTFESYSIIESCADFILLIFFEAKF